VNNLRVTQHKQRIDAVFDIAAKVSAAPDSAELVSHLSRYLCILTSGWIEQSVRHVLDVFVRNHGGDVRVRSFAESRVQEFQNATSGKIIMLVGEFSEAWRQRLELELGSHPEIKDAVDSVVAARHQIAHGQSTGISFVVIQDYYKRVSRFIELLESVCSQ